MSIGGGFGIYYPADGKSQAFLPFIRLGLNVICIHKTILMKTKILIAVALFISFIAVAGSFSSSPSRISLKEAFRTPDPVFDFVRSHRQGKGITMTWGSSATSSVVNCFTVIRTYEDPTDPYSEWTPVCDVNCNASRSYKSTDDNVSPGFVSYRVVASMIGGGYVYSDIETVHIVQH